MPTPVLVALALLASYLAGSVPFAYLVTKAVRGVDVRTIGSGNVGATNASRVLGGKWFMVVFTLDALKGALPVLLLAPLTGVAGDDLLLVRLACGLAAFAGHVFPVFLGFRGGKGVATATGVLAALAWVPCACGLAAFFVTLAVTRYVSLGSVVAGVALVPAAWFLDRRPPIVGFCAVVAVLVVVLHRKNMRRIAAGTEPRVFARKPAEAPHA